MATPLEIANQVVNLVNQRRSLVGLPALTLDTQLSSAADAHSTDMALNDFFGQNGSNGSTAATRISNAGYNFTTYAQNIAAGEVTPEQVVASWFSTGEGSNLLKTNVTNIGVGLYYLANDTGRFNQHYYWTVLVAARGGASTTPITGNTDEPNSLAGATGGDNIIFGGSADDTVVGNTGNDYILGYAGNDQIDGLEGDDTLGGNQGNDTILGGPGKDYIAGGKGNDQLTGERGDDTITGDLGNDTLLGGH
jgi:Ca2+-binding RTX toxin-like protein